MRSIVRTGVLAVLASACATAQDTDSRPGDVYTRVGPANVHVVSGTLPDSRRWAFGFSPVVDSWSVTCSGGASAFFDSSNADAAPSWPLLVQSRPGADVIATLTSTALASDCVVRISGTLLGNSTREEFLKAADRHFTRLMESRLPGGAWFRHRLAVIRAELPPKAEEERPPRRATIFAPPPDEVDDDEASSPYQFFSGGRAVAENLRLDRALAPIEGGRADVPIDEIEGITTQAFDWTTATASLDPPKDALAGFIPEDQHAAFFPDLAAVVAMLDALVGHSPVLQALEERYEDGGVRRFYEGQLALSARELADDDAAKAVRSIAVTGSDPYFRTGTDIAILFESDRPAALRGFVEARQGAAKGARTDAVAVAGTIGGKAYSGILTPDRGLSSFVCELDGAVAVANSLQQLGRIVKTAGEPETALAASKEYVFFRDRYRRDQEETVFMLLTDATIRRWCGPRWRIGAARRTRAAAQLADLTARHADAVVEDRKPDPISETPAGLGPIAWTPEGPHSEHYGNLRFLTPIVELDVERVTTAERAQYGRFRDSYQFQWAEYFDPIAVRLHLGRTTLAIDATVMPLVASSEYRWLMDLAREVRVSPMACDPHDDGALQIVVGVDGAAAAMEPWERRARTLVPDLKPLALSWLKGGVSISLEQHPVLATLDYDSGRRLPEWPLLLSAEVADPVALAIFLAGLKSAMHEVALGSVRWTKGTHRDVETMTMESAEGIVDELTVSFAIVDRLLLVSLRRDVLHRAIDRALDRRAGKVLGKPWLGESVAVRVDKSFLDHLEGRDEEWRQSDRQAFAWRALPILSEWRRIWPDRDPADVHETLFKVRLLDPAGGRYLVDPRGRVVSEHFGCPAESRPGPKGRTGILEGFKEGRAGLTFENDGLRARVVIERDAR